jgi:hypothetical protein
MVGGTSNDLSYGITKICAVPVGRIIAHSAGWASFTVCQMPTAPISHVCSLKAPSMDISHSGAGQIRWETSAMQGRSGETCGKKRDIQK